MPTSQQSQGTGLPVPLTLQLLAVCLIIVSCKLWLMHLYSSPLPFLDQWDGEGIKLLQPWLTGHWRLGDLFAPFNEHRIVWTRLLVLAAFEGNARQWDAQVEMVAGALLHTACAFCLGAVLIRLLGHSRALPIFAALLMLFCLPFDWQNTLWGFQSAFYFLILFTLLALRGLGLHAPGTARWWVGLSAGVLACFSMGSGGLAGLALAAWIGLQVLFVRDSWRCRAPLFTLGAAFALVVLGVLLYTPPEVQTLTQLQARSAGAFILSWGARLGWPNIYHPLFALPTYAPLAVLLWKRLRELRRDAALETNVHRPEHASHGTPGRNAEDFLFPLGFWVMLQAAALAFARNQSVVSQVSRYTDIQALGILVNFCCLFRLLPAVGAGPAWQRRTVVALSLTWITLFVVGLVPHLQQNLRVELPTLRRINAVQILATRRFLLTGREEDLGGKPVFGLPPDKFTAMAGLLRDPQIQNILPSSLDIRRQKTLPGALSTATQILLPAWMGLFVAGLLLWLMATGWKWRRATQTAGVRTAEIPPLAEGAKADFV